MNSGTSSIVVADGPVGEAVDPTISVIGGEVTLGWAAEIGKEYTIRWSENGRQWEVLTIVMADTEGETHKFSAVGGAAAQYFQVSKNE